MILLEKNEDNSQDLSTKTSDLIIENVESVTESADNDQVAESADSDK